MMTIRQILNKLLSLVIVAFLFNVSVAISTDDILNPPLDYVKEGDFIPPLFSAILKEDKNLYLKEMKSLLNQPIKTFNEVISYKTDKGDTIFHLMAGVRSHQEFFTKEMENLKNIFSEKVSRTNYQLNLGAVTISIPYLEDTKIGQFIIKKKASDFVSFLEDLEKAPAKEWLLHFHAKTKEGQSAKDFISKNFDMSPISHIWSQNLKVFEKHPDISALFFSKNNQVLSLKDVAYQSNNFLAYTFLSKELKNRVSVSENNLNKVSFSVGALAGVGLSFVSGNVPYSLQPELLVLFKTLETLSYGYLGGIASQFSSEKCRNVFEKMKTNRLRKNFDRSRRQL